LNGTRASTLHFSGITSASPRKIYMRATRKLHARTRQSRAEVTPAHILCSWTHACYDTLLLALTTRTLSLACPRSLDLLASSLARSALML